MTRLHNRIALVAGATRGAGRGIAVALGEAGATVWCTGRSVAGATPPGRPETIEETAELVTAAGGTGHWLQVDHTDPAAVARLAEHIRARHGGLDLLVNDIWGGDALTHWGPLWEHDLDDGLRMLQSGLITHLVTARLLLPLMLDRERALLVEVTDGVGEHYRGSLFFDLVKASTRRLGLALHAELAPRGHMALTVTPGFLRSEAMLSYFGVSEAEWRTAISQDAHFAASETPRFVGRGLAALAADPERERFGGQVLSSGQLGACYGLQDVDGRRPDFSRYAVETLCQGLEALSAEDLAGSLGCVATLSQAVGEHAAPFVGVGGEGLLERLRRGEPLQQAVAATVCL